MKRLMTPAIVVAFALVGSACGTSATVDVAAEASATTAAIVGDATEQTGAAAATAAATIEETADDVAGEGAAAAAPEPAAQEQDEERAAAAGNGAPRVYEVQLVNPHTAQPFSPPAWAVHDGEYDMIEIGEPASYGVKEVAENADGQPLAYALSLGVPGVFASGLTVSDAVSSGPILPGTSRTWQVNAAEGSQMFSFVSMIGCTNDGLIFADAVTLPADVGSSVSFPLTGYDAGTELNDENLDHMMPPCSQGARGSFISDPTLAENGVVALHSGIVGDADLPLEQWRWDDPIGELIITRTS